MKSAGRIVRKQNGAVRRGGRDGEKDKEHVQQKSVGFTRAEGEREGGGGNNEQWIGETGDASAGGSGGECGFLERVRASVRETTQKKGV